jgi:predicted Zn-dependent protease
VNRVNGVLEDLMRCKLECWTAIALVYLAATACAQEDVIVKAMRDEMARTVTQLRLHDLDRPYFVAYRVKEIDNASVSASLGSLTDSHPTCMRLLSVELRVGDYSLDNSNYLSPKNFSGGMSRMFSGIEQVPLDDNYLEIRRQLWLATDAEYKKALEDLSGKRAALQTRKEAEHVADFSKEQPANLYERPDTPKTDISVLEHLARDISAPFKEMPNIFVSAVTIELQNSYTRYLNSEGTSFTRSEPLLKMEIRAETQAPDGQPIRDSIQLWGRSVSALPNREQITARVREMGARLARLREATSIESYNGPVLFDKQAGAEIFAQVFAPGLLATRMPMSDDPQFELFFDQFTRQVGGGSFIDKIGGRVLPDFLDVIDNPKLKEYAGSELLGSYLIDDDGVPTRETKLIEKGILKTLLATRTPVKTIAHSTGNRRGWGPAPSNLIVTAENSSSDEQLRRELLRRVRQRGLNYGILVRRLGGGGLEALMQAAAMVTRQAAPSAMLVEVYKLFPDGHEEPVNGIELSDMTAAMFKDIVAVGDKPCVYTDQFIPKFGALFSFGMASGSDLPQVSFVVPPLLLDDVTLTKVSGPFPSPPFTKPPLSTVH